MTTRTLSANHKTTPSSCVLVSGGHHLQRPKESSPTRHTLIKPSELAINPAIQVNNWMMEVTTIGPERISAQNS